MKPVTSSVDVPQRRRDVYDFLDCMANHASFTDHYLTDWRVSGPATGVGARAEVVATLGRRAQVSVRVVEAEAPEVIVERNVSANGIRTARGTYRLAELPDGGTRVSFVYAWDSAPLTDKLLSPVVRRLVRRANNQALRRLKATLERRRPGPTPNIQR